MSIRAWVTQLAVALTLILSWSSAAQAAESSARAEKLKQQLKLMRISANAD